LETTFQETRDHLSVETQRQWPDLGDYSANGTLEDQTITTPDRHNATRRLRENRSLGQQRQAPSGHFRHLGVTLLETPS
jgi:hypothetical protein